jgi:hypothetical protein
MQPKDGGREIFRVRVRVRLEVPYYAINSGCEAKTDRE